MAVLGTTGSGAITMPKELTNGIWAKAQAGSTIATLSGSEPQKFGESDIMTFNTAPRAEFVAEGGQKSASEAGFGVKTVKPHKAQVTIRVNEEVLWADEDYQLSVLAELGGAISTALSRALDLGAIHAINPLSGTAAGSISDYLTQTTNVVTIGANADVDVESAAGLVIANEFVPNGIALDPKYVWTLSTAQYADGRKKFPDLGLGIDISNFAGLAASVSSTVSGMPEAADTTVRGIVGDFNTLRWGVQREIPIEVIKYGDPDGQGDLKRKNQVALRAETVFGWAFMDKAAFAVLKTA